MAWNILLAVIPVGLAYAISGVAGLTGSYKLAITKRVVMPILAIAWLVFLPNTCYLLTEWRHFLEMLGYTNLHIRWQVDASSALLLMFLTLFYLCYSGIGVLTFALAIRPVVRLVRERISTMWVWEILFFLMMSVGVYLGLVHRFNSWDLIGEFSQIWASIVNIGDRPVLGAFIILFAGFLWLVYLAVDIWIDGFVYRISEMHRK